MSMRKKSAEQSQPAGRTFLEQEIEDFFKTLNLGTVAEREGFLQFARPEGNASPTQEIGVADEEAFFVVIAIDKAIGCVAVAGALDNVAPKTIDFVGGHVLEGVVQRVTGFQFLAIY